MSPRAPLCGACRVKNSGTGPGAFTNDGCAVEHYRRLGVAHEADLIAAAVPAAGTILELGAGAGRVTHPLVSMGYRLTAVDSSADMLSHIVGAETVHAEIEQLALGRTFDAVLLCSNLINVPSERDRAALLGTCLRHVAPEGVVVLERYVPSNVRNAKDGLLDERDGIRSSLRNFALRGKEFSATIVHEAPDAAWTQTFRATILDDDDIERALGKAGLTFGRWLDGAKSWLTATPTSAGSSRSDPR